MAETIALGADDAVARLRAAGEPTRLRILALLAVAELSVKDLTQILGQSQPRISRHLKLLAEAGLIARHREGAWVNLRFPDAPSDGAFARLLTSLLDAEDAVLRRDRQRALELVAERARLAQDYFQQNAGEWDRLRALHVDEAQVEAAMREALGEGPFARFLDMGTGTGRILEMFAGRYRSGIGIDSNPSMLTYARSRIEAEGLSHAQVRQGDVYNLSLPSSSCDAIVMHQVLHYLGAPKAAIAEMARVLAPHGRLLIVDFAPHDLVEFRDRYAHQLLGIARADLDTWATAAGLQVVDDVALRQSQSDAGGTLTVKVWTISHTAAHRVRAGRQIMEGAV